MSSRSRNEGSATVLLRAWRGGDASALEQLAPLVYRELRQRAARYLNRERAGHTLQATELVHEAFLRLVDADISWQDRAHFLAVAAGSMRRLLVDHARARSRDKRGGDQAIVSLEEVRIGEGGPQTPREEILALDEALRELAARDARTARIVELSFFGGLKVREIAEVVGQSKSGVHRELSFAKAWLHRRMGRGDKSA